MRWIGWTLYAIALVALGAAIWYQASTSERAHKELEARRTRGS